jgi:hypothetical protein
LGKPITNKVRERIQQLLLEDSLLSKDERALEECFYNLDEIQMMMPLHIPNYTDFYSSIQHATNVGMMFRDPANALLPNWKHLPVITVVLRRLFYQELISQDLADKSNLLIQINRFSAHQNNWISN